MAKKNRQKKPAEQNLVAKHAKTFNLAHVFEDRKKAAKRGKVKHKGGWDYQLAA